MRNVNKCEFALDSPIFYFVEWGDAMVTNLWQCDNGGHLVTATRASWCHQGRGIIGNIYFETRTFYCGPLVTPTHNAHTGERRPGWMVRADIMAEVWMGAGIYRWWILTRCVSPQDGGILTKLTQWLTMVTIHPLAPILGVNSSTGASFQQAPYKYKLTTLTAISPCSLHLFKLEICQLLSNKSVLY